MGFHRSPDRDAARNAWRSFVSRNSATILAAGLPNETTRSIASWDEFLNGQRGELRSKFSEVQYAALTQLIDSYFSAGYEYFTPHVLRREEQQLLNARYGSTEDA